MKYRLYRTRTKASVRLHNAVNDSVFVECVKGGKSVRESERCELTHHVVARQKRIRNIIESLGI